MNVINYIAMRLFYDKRQTKNNLDYLNYTGFAKTGYSSRSALPLSTKTGDTSHRRVGCKTGMCLMMSSKTVPAPNRPVHDTFNRKFELEQQYNLNASRRSVRTKVLPLNQQQKTAYETVIIAVNKGYEGI